jgi:hypothetical protein
MMEIFASTLSFSYSCVLICAFFASWSARPGFGGLVVGGEFGDFQLGLRRGEVGLQRSDGARDRGQASSARHSPVRP